MGNSTGCMACGILFFKKASRGTYCLCIERIKTNMKKQHSIIPVIILSILLLSGCGKKGDAPVNPASSDPGNNVISSEEANKTDNESQDIDASQPQDENSQVQETPEPKKASVSLKNEYSDTVRTVSILGLQEYKTIKTDKYVDKAPKGSRYLALFLRVYNKENEKDYFNVNYLTAKVDGRKIENTFLFNEPEGYPTIFTNIGGGEAIEGFIVWEVPADWKKLKVTYKGWKDIDGLTLDAELSRKDLKKPGHYNGKN